MTSSSRSRESQPDKGSHFATALYLVNPSIPAGLSHIAITYVHTFDQTIGNILSLVLLLSAFRYRSAPAAKPQ